MIRRVLVFVFAFACGAQTPGTLPTSSHTCGQFVDPLRDRREISHTDTRNAFPEYAKFHACECKPPSDSNACGPFPCSSHGCYVAQCRMDADCKLGVCSSHASGPHGYCVTDDPY